MDTFFNKLSQRANAQELIKANSAADAAKMEQMQEQMDKYDGLLKEQMSKYDGMLKEQMGKYDGMFKEQTNKYDSLLQEMRKVNLKTIENMEQMQKVMNESLQKVEAIQENSDIKDDILPEMKKQMEEAIHQSDDFLHKENVKVYRNVQAAMTEELDKQTEKLSANQQESAKGQKVLIPLSVVTIILIIADIAVNLLNITISF